MGGCGGDLSFETEVRKDFLKVDVGMPPAQDVQIPCTDVGPGRHTRREGGMGSGGVSSRRTGRRAPRCSSRAGLCRPTDSACIIVPT
eukprot:4511502-Pyramimonas_sp.AAC.1